MNNNTTIIEWKKKSPSNSSSSIKWNIGNAKYEIHTPELEDLDLSYLLPHCVDVRNKVLSTVTTEAHKSSSLFRVFPRTISIVLRTIWDNLVEDMPDNPSLADFDGRLQDFIAAHATAEDRHELIAQLRAARKPREMPVQTFYYRLRELSLIINVISTKVKRPTS